MKNYVQRFGKFLSAMVMPNIGALIAFGFLAALFIDTGWIPNEGFNSMVSPMLTYLIPILIASTGGRMIGGDRGRVVGAIAVIGAIMSNTSITMLMAAMVMGPLAGFCIKKFDQLMEGHMPAGFEMLINNFSAGIIGMILAMLGYILIGPIMSGILAVLSAGVNILVQNSLLPLVAIFIEPAKVLFLNNAINHGIFTPLATAQAADMGKSIMYMLEPNPGPGLGVLLAYMFFCLHLLVQHHRLRTCGTGISRFDHCLSYDDSGIRFDQGDHRRAAGYRYLLCRGFPYCKDGGRQEPGRSPERGGQHEECFQGRNCSAGNY